MAQWDQIYRTGKYLRQVHADVIEAIEFFKAQGVRRVLDLACGGGRNAMYLAERGYEVHGLDISEEGISIARSLAQERDFQVALAVGSMYEPLPYADDFFDAILCIRSLHHGPIEDIRLAIKEMERVLKPGEFAYVTVRQQELHERREPFKEIAPMTHIPLAGKEQGVIHYLFTEESLRDEFHNFKLHQIGITRGPEEWGAYYYLLGELRNI